jgi:hypothetical protein
VQRYFMADIVEDRAQQRGSLGVEHVQTPVISNATIVGGPARFSN